ncbi:MAG: Glycosyltransferase, family 4, partial [Candidatus Levybacteria bacterium GW2011_GWB1_35_5]
FLIHPSFKEGFGLTVLEAAASGTPTIARQGSSMDELIESGKNGLLFSTDTQISKLFIKYFDNVKYQKLAKNALEMSRKYDWKQILSNSRKITQI